MLLACSVTTNAQSDKKYQKALDKVYKTRYKELKKEGWKVSDKERSRCSCRATAEEGGVESVGNEHDA
jgi:hypothetical protein